MSFKKKNTTPYLGDLKAVLIPPQMLVVKSVPERGLREGVRALGSLGSPPDLLVLSPHRPDEVAGAGGRRGAGQGADLPGQPLRVQRALAGAPPGEGG